MPAYGSALRRFLRDESGATAIEYALIGTLISVVIIGSVMSVGDRVEAMWGTIAAAL